MVRPDLPAVGVVVLPLHDALVVRHGGRHDQGQQPDEQHAERRVPAHADPRRLSGVHDGHVAVHGHGRQREDADEHGDGEEVVDELADEGAQHPRGQYVDGGLEGYAEEQVGEVGHAQVEDEDVGGAPRLARLAAREHRDHHGVAERAEEEDEAEDEQGDEVVHPDAQDVFGRQSLALILHLRLHRARMDERSGRWWRRKRERENLRVSGTTWIVWNDGELVRTGYLLPATSPGPPSNTFPVFTVTRQPVKWEWMNEYEVRRQIIVDVVPGGIKTEPRRSSSVHF